MTFRGLQNGQKPAQETEGIVSAVGRNLGRNVP